MIKTPAELIVKEIVDKYSRQKTLKNRLKNKSADNTSYSICLNNKDVVHVFEEIYIEELKTHLRKDIDFQRITYKDYQGFFGIRLDDMMTKTFCKLFFNNTKKLSIRTIFKDKTENIYDIENIDDIYNYADDIINAAKSFL